MIATVVSGSLAYIGPGAGLGLIGAFISLLVSVGFALAMVVAWPIRSAIKKYRTAQASQDAGTDAGVPHSHE